MRGKTSRTPHKKIAAFDAVLFDLDGTLADTARDIAASVNHVRMAFGRRPLAVATVRRYVGDGVKILMERSLGTRDGEVIARSLKILLPHYQAHCMDHTRLYPGIKPMLKTLAAHGIPMGVVSNKPEAASVETIERTGLAGFFKAVVGGETVPFRKPAPEPFFYALRKMGVPRSARILVVGDGATDVLGARAAGFQCCGVLWGFRSEETVRATRPDFMARTPRDITRVVMPGS